MYPKTEEMMTDFLAEGVMPGVSYAFIRGNEVERQTKGYAQLTPNVEILREEMLFDMASLTKVICTTTMVLKLIELGKLKIDDPVYEYLPTFEDRKVTIRHLLTHTSGINPFIENRDQLNALELKTAMLKLKSTESLGKEVVYTDTGTVLLGFMLEEIYQKDLHTLFHSEVLTPLEMTASTFQPPKKLAVPTEFRVDRGLIRGEVHDPKAFTLKADCGSAGLFSSLNDCVIFVQMVLDLGKAPSGKSFLRPETITSLLKDQTPTKNLERSLGWDLKRDPVKDHVILFHTGYTGTFLLIDVKEQRAFIFLSNRVHPIDYRKEYLQKRDQLVATYLEESAFNEENLV